MLRYEDVWAAAVWAVAVSTDGCATIRGTGPRKRRQLASAAMSCALRRATSMTRPLADGRTPTVPPTKASVASRGAVSAAGAIFWRPA